MRSFLYVAFFLFEIFFNSISILQAADLHAILVADFFSFDIQNASASDLKKMYALAKEVAKNGNFKLKATVLAGKESMGKKLISKIKKLNVQEKDVIIFYFSGHGYRTGGHADSPWPFLDFPEEHCGISFKSIIDAIKSKDAWFSLILADCCNWEIPHGYAPPVLPLKSMLVSKDIQQKSIYQKLFCQTKGVIAIVSAQPGQASYCSQFGSFFTISLIESLQAAIGGYCNANWEDIISNSRDLLAEHLKLHNLKQIPFMQMKIKSSDHIDH